MTRYLGCLAVALAIAACGTDPFSPATDKRFVVQAYLYAGEPVTDIRITSTLPLGSTDSVAPPINDAAVTLVKEGERYPLAPTPGESGAYHDPGADPQKGDPADPPRQRNLHHLKSSTHRMQ